MNNLLNKFLSAGQNIPELSQVYHHAYFRDLDANVLAGNNLFAAYIDRLELPPHEKINYRDFIPNKLLKTIFENDNHVFHDKTPKVFSEYCYIKRNDICINYMNLLSIKAPFYDENGLMGLFGISLDVTNQNMKQLMEIINLVNNIVEDNYSTNVKLHFDNEAALKRPGLTPREIECLSLYMRGNTTKGIASHLALSNRTVEFYMDNIKSKFGINKRCELLELAFKLYPELINGL